jgi:hypothetical protein
MAEIDVVYCLFDDYRPIGTVFRGLFLFEFAKAILILAPFSFYLGKKLNRKRGAPWFAVIGGLIVALFSVLAIPYLELIRQGVPLEEIGGLISRAFVALLLGPPSAIAYWYIAMRDAEPVA